MGLGKNNNSVVWKSAVGRKITLKSNFLTNKEYTKMNQPITVGRYRIKGVAYHCFFWKDVQYAVAEKEGSAQCIVLAF